jgi:hypothetical protein
MEQPKKSQPVRVGFFRVVVELGGFEFIYIN